MGATSSSASVLARAVQIIGRAVRRRCPNCGGAGIFATWFRMVERCPTCGLGLAGEEGHRAGAYMFNIAMAELIFVAILVGVLAVTWPSPPWAWLTYGSAAVMVALPVAFYPFSQTLFVGFDLLFHRSEDDGFRPPGDPSSSA